MGCIIVTWENDDPATPNSFKWSLTDSEGSIVNGREQQVETPAHELDIVLSGSDLPSGVLTVTVEGTYNSDLGSDLPYNDWCSFRVRSVPIY